MDDLEKLLALKSKETHKFTKKIMKHSMGINMDYMTLTTRKVKGGTEIGYKVNRQVWILDDNNIPQLVGIVNEDDEFYLVLGEPDKIGFAKKSECLDTKAEAEKVVFPK